MGITTSNLKIDIIGVRGTGVMGIWLFTVEDGKNRFAVEFTPDWTRYGRISMIPADGFIAPPDHLCDAFSEFIRGNAANFPSQAQQRILKKGGGPGEQIRALSNIILNEGLLPREDVLHEVTEEIKHHFYNPHYIQPTKGKENRYWFRSPAMGRFYVTQRPPTT